MARNIGPRHKLCRRVGEPLCGQANCPVLKKRAYPPGQHGQAGRRGKLSEYGVRLLEKQKLRRIYNVMENQFRRYFQRAARGRGDTGLQLLQLLETRLDNVVYRLGFASTIQAARQLVSHGHIEVNGRRVNIPSYQVKPGDVVALREKSRSLQVVGESLAASMGVQPYLSREDEQFRGQLVRLPAREEIPIKINDKLIIEHYSR